MACSTRPRQNCAPPKSARHAARAAEHRSMKLANRLDHIEPFYVMEFAKLASELARSPACDPARGGEPMIFCNIGEPDFTAPPLVQAAADAAIAAGRSQYTDATGLKPLRERIAGWYAEHQRIDIDPSRIIVTAGA